MTDRKRIYIRLRGRSPVASLTIRCALLIPAGVFSCTQLSAQSSTQPSARSSAQLSLQPSGSSSAIAEKEPDPFPDTATLQALVYNHRPVFLRLEYRGIVRADTGTSLEECHVFRNQYGGRIFVLPAGLAGENFRIHGSYNLSLVFTGYTRRGIPLARNTPDAGHTIPLRVGEDIRESDPRLAEIKGEIRKNGAAPKSLRLRYSGVRDDFLVFFDLVGDIVYFRYREDRFDLRAEKKIRNLISGAAYLVSGELTGLFYADKYFNRSDPEFISSLEKKDAILIFLYQEAKPLRLENTLLK